MAARLVLLQLTPRDSKEEQLHAIEALASRARPGSIIAVPEYAMLDPTGRDPGEVARAAEDLDGPWLSRLRGLARRLESCLVATMFERGPRGKPYNTVVLVDERGEVAGVYRKNLLFDALGYRESDYFEPGPEPPRPVDLCGLRIGVAVCFEIRFPELFRAQALDGAEAFIVPSAWYTGPGKEEQYRFLAQARAHENTAWLAAPIMYGAHFTGRSLVVNPYGVVVADTGHGERVLEYEVDPGLAREARERLPLLEALRRRGLDSIYEGLRGRGAS